MAIEPNGDKIFDPYLGRERDAFPGEVKPEGEQTSFDKALATAARPYFDLYNLAAQRGGLSPEELTGVLKAAEIAKNDKSKELEAAFKENPATILQNLFINAAQQTTDEGMRNNFNFLLGSIDSKIFNDQRTIQELRREDLAAGRPELSIGDYAETVVIQGGSLNGNLLASLNTGTQGSLANESLAVLKALKIVPDSTQDLTEFTSPIIRSGNTVDSGRPYCQRLNGGAVISGLKPQVPGLEGVFVKLEYMNRTNKSIEIRATPDTFVKIAETQAGFVPYSTRRLQPTNGFLIQ